MIYRLICLLLLINHLLSGQITHLVPNQISFKQQYLDSLGFKWNSSTMTTKLRACGQFNQQAAATLISNDGLILVPRAAVLEYLPKSIDPFKGFWANHSDQELALTGGFITFQLDSKEVSDFMLKGIQTSDAPSVKQSKIAQNRVQLKMQSQATQGQSILIKALYQEQVYYQYRLATFTKISLVALPPDRDQQAFALLRISKFDKNDELLALPLKSKKPTSPEVKVAIIDFPTVSKFNSNSYELALAELRYEILQDLDTKVLDAYQNLNLDVPYKIKSQHQENQSIRAYFQEADLLAQKQAFEKTLLLDSNCKQVLDQLNSNNALLEELYSLKTYGQEAFNRLKVYQLVNLLNRYLKFNSSQFEQNRTRLLSDLKKWSKNWNPTLDQQLFAPMAAAYFSKTKAKYLSNYIMDQIKVTNQSYSDLAVLLYTNSILTQPADLVKLLAKDQSSIQKVLDQDLAFRFFAQYALDMDQKLLPAFKKQNDLFLINSGKLARAQQDFLKEAQWTTESNGTQRIHFTNVLQSGPFTFLTMNPGFPGTDMAPALDLEGYIIGFRPENKALSSAYIWDGKPSQNPVHDIINTSSILDYLSQQPKAASILKELKKAP